MIMPAFPPERPLSRGGAAATSALSGMPFLFLMMAVYRLIVTLPPPDSVAGVIALRALSVAVMALAMVGTIAIVTWTARRLAERAYSRMWRADADLDGPPRVRLERHA